MSEDAKSPAADGASELDRSTAAPEAQQGLSDEKGWLRSDCKETPIWMRSLYAALPSTAVFILHGNTHDLYPARIGGNLRPSPMVDTVWQIMLNSGFDGLLTFDPVNGLQVAFTRDGLDGQDIRRCLESALGGNLAELLFMDAPHRAALMADARQGGASLFAGLSSAIEAVACGGDHALALMVDYTAQALDSAIGPDDVLMQAMTVSREIADAHMFYQGRMVRFVHSERAGMTRHPVIWLGDRPDDFPQWMTRGEGVRQIPVAVPDIDARMGMSRLLLQGGHTFEENEAAVRRFAEATEGFTARGMFEVVRLAESMGPVDENIEAAVRVHRQGLSENPWQGARLREQLSDGRAVLTRRVFGQEAAVSKVLDILKRSALGLTAAHSKRPSGTPRGVLYFAGPTGVGKTEMAKSIAELVFADEKALIRFDMSEFQDDHAKIRLVGAPPSYVGHGSGGELTNAVRERPHSIILFDEMDKAGREVNDLFLQILSDGRLTDGSGRTVLFNECIIIFTSNQGVAAAGNILDLDMQDPEQEALYEATIRNAVERHFRESLGRPELLGRLGDNIVVFHPMQGEVARSLALSFVENILSNVRIRVGNRVSFSDEAMEVLVDAATAPNHLASGGRGIANALEEYLVNPLGRILFDVDSGRELHVGGIRLTEDGKPQLLFEERS